MACYIPYVTLSRQFRHSSIAVYIASIYNPLEKSYCMSLPYEVSMYIDM